MESLLCGSIWLLVTMHCGPRQRLEQCVVLHGPKQTFPKGHFPETTSGSKAALRSWITQGFHSFSWTFKSEQRYRKGKTVNYLENLYHSGTHFGWEEKETSPVYLKLEFQSVHVILSIHPGPSYLIVRYEMTVLILALWITREDSAWKGGGQAQGHVSVSKSQD